jgi:hypothetical protein
MAATAASRRPGGAGEVGGEVWGGLGRSPRPARHSSRCLDAKSERVPAIRPAGWPQEAAAASIYLSPVNLTWQSGGRRRRPAAGKRQADRAAWPRALGPAVVSKGEAAWRARRGLQVLSALRRQCVPSCGAAAAAGAARAFGRAGLVRQRPASQAGGWGSDERRARLRLQLAALSGAAAAAALACASPHVLSCSQRPTWSTARFARAQPVSCCEYQTAVMMDFMCRAPKRLQSVHPHCKRREARSR